MHEIERLYRQAFGKDPLVALRSPPDVFAVCCSFVKLTGAYLTYATKSTNQRRVSVKAAIRDGANWRSTLDSKLRPNAKELPLTVLTAWSYIGDNITKSLNALASDKNFVNSCLYLIVAADEACVGVGVPSEPAGSYFVLDAEARIGDRGTLCRSIPAESLSVLPKQHTPKSGFNIRSLTHHLSLLSASEVAPKWTQMPYEPSPRSSFNILMAPWPITMDASDLKPANRKSNTDGFGYFDYSPRVGDSVAIVNKWVQHLFRYAHKIGQEIDLLLFPEAALDLKQWRSVSRIATQNGATVIAGVREKSLDGFSENSLRIKTPFDWQPEYIQYKHHRWQIEATQIVNYGLGGTLSTEKSWWENIKLHDRSLRFIASRPDLVLCPLICEDLARQDPVAELVRSVGPNLVIALLMDGPQMAERWSARYATVLADDPGSSVLTISSLGMVKLSRPQNCKPSRIFGSWKDTFGRHTPLEISERETGLILNLQFRISEECSIDGRSDGGVSSTPVLCGVHPIAEGGAP